MKIFDLPKWCWSKNPLWKMVCSDCNQLGPAGVSLDCGHILCGNCLFPRCSPGGETFACPVCWRASRAMNVCSCSIPDTIMHAKALGMRKDVVGFGLSCPNPGCKKLIPPAKLPYFVYSLLGCGTYSKLYWAR